MRAGLRLLNDTKLLECYQNESRVGCIATKCSLYNTMKIMIALLSLDSKWYRCEVSWVTRRISANDIIWTLKCGERTYYIIYIISPLQVTADFTCAHAESSAYLSYPSPRSSYSNLILRRSGGGVAWRR